jgi:hypothetical protein
MFQYTSCHYMWWVHYKIHCTPVEEGRGQIIFFPLLKFTPGCVQRRSLKFNTLPPVTISSNGKSSIVEERIFRFCSFYFDPVRFFASILPISGIRWVRSSSIFRICGINRLRIASIFPICGINRVRSASIFRICGINRLRCASIFLRCRISRVRFASIFTSSGISRFVSLRSKLRSAFVSISLSFLFSLAGSRSVYTRWSPCFHL